MKHFLSAFSLLLALAIPALAQVPQGTSMRATNGIGFGVTTIANRLLATNLSGTNHFSGTLNSRSNISSQAVFYGDGSGLTNIGGAFTNLPFQDLSMSLNTFGDSLVSGEAGPPGWVYTMKTNLSDVTEIINYGGSGYQQYDVTTAFLASGGHTNEPYMMEIAFNGYTGDPAVDGSNRLYWIRVAVSNTPPPKRFLLLQMANDHGSSNSTARYEFTTNINATFEALYPDNYYPWWDWFKMQTNGSAQDDADFAAGVPPSSLMNADGIHPNSEGNYRLGTNMAGVWTAFLRSYQEPVLTGDLPTLFKGFTNVTLAVKNLTVGGLGTPFVPDSVVPDGSIRMDNTNGVVVWKGAQLRGGLKWWSPSVYLRTINVDPTTGDLLFGQSGVTDASFYTDGSFNTRGIGYIPQIQLGLSTAATARSVDSPAYGDLIEAMHLRTYSFDGSVMSPRLILTTALSGSGGPGVAQVIVSNANFNVGSGFIAYGDAAGMSNAVTLIAGGCISITTNADGRTFTLSIAGSGADVLTNNRSGATLPLLTALGGTFGGDGSGLTNIPQSSITDSFWRTNPAAATPSISNTFNLKTTGTIQVSNAAVANTAMTLSPLLLAMTNSADANSVTIGLGSGLTISTLKAFNLTSGSSDKVSVRSGSDAVATFGSSSTRGLVVGRQIASASAPTDGLRVETSIYADASYFSNDCSALTFTDRSESPDTLEQATRIVASIEPINGKVDHSRMDPLLWGKTTTLRDTGRTETNVVAGVEIVVPVLVPETAPDQSKRNLSMLASAQALVIQDLIRRIEILEAAK